VVQWKEGIFFIFNVLDLGLANNPADHHYQQESKMAGCSAF
jgi:hypothetical protein